MTSDRAHLLATIIAEPDVDTREILPGYLPAHLWEHDAISGDFLGGRGPTAFQPREAAEAGLSARLIIHGRSLAGLPPLGTLDLFADAK